MITKQYHRLGARALDEQKKVIQSGFLWGTSPRIVAGNGPPCVKAFLGPLPPGETGYTFETWVVPTAHRRFLGREGAIWEEDGEDVLPVPGNSDFVMIAVEVPDG